MKLSSLSKRTVVAVAVAFSLYVAAFIFAFDVLSQPVRHQQHGWLGPVVRGDTQLVDIGKVYDLDTEPSTPYRNFRPLCVLWLWANGLPTNESCGEDENFQ